VREMEACWPFGVVLRGKASNRPDAALAEDRRGERSGKRRGCGGITSGGDQEDVPQASASVGVTVDASKGIDGIESEGPPLALVSSLAGARFIGQVVPGV